MPSTTVFHPTPEIPDALFRGEQQRALTAQEYYYKRASQLHGTRLDLKLEVIDASAEINFAAAIATHAATYLSPDDLQEAIEPLIESCTDQSERVLAAYEEYQPLLHKRSPVIALHLTYPLLRQSILSRALYTYPPDNDAAASARQELARNAYACSKAPLPEMFEAYNLGRDTAKRYQEAEVFSGSVQEATINALINRESSSNCLALPALDAEDHYFKSDNMVLTYDDFGSFIQYIQSKNASRNRKTNDRRERNDTIKPGDLPFQALVHPELLGNAKESRKRMRKTWATTLAIMSERIGTMHDTTRTDGIAEHLTEKRKDVLGCLRKEAVTFPLRLWNIPSRLKD